MNIKIIISMLFLLILTLSAAIAAENQSKPRLNDAEIRQKLVGKWLVDLNSIRGRTLTGSTSNFSNGTCLGESIFKREQNANTNISYECIWEVKDGFLIKTVTKTDNPKLIPLGLVTRDYVIRVDDKQYAYRTESGMFVVRERIMDGN